MRWTPAVVFPELGADGALRLDRSLGPRGQIVGAGDTVWAMNRDDGVRVYPQEALAGQTIGYVAEVTAEDLETLAQSGYRAGDVVGRSGLEAGAEALLRGTPGWQLVAVTTDAPETVLLETEQVPGADVTITLRPNIQAAAQSAAESVRGCGDSRPRSAERGRVGARQPARVQSELDDLGHDDGR